MPDINAMQNAYRYAIYFAPSPDTPWWHAGSQWLGRCAISNSFLGQTAPALFSQESFCQLTAPPRRYGWHATMKAPFKLNADTALVQLKDALKKISHQLIPFELPKLQVSRLDDFIALTPVGDTSSISLVERECVIGLHPFAAPLPPDELLRRRSAGLSLAKDSMLLRWGYPFVLDHFRFHMSLTGPLRDCTEAQIHALIQSASERFDHLPPCNFDSLALFAEPVKGDDFVLLERFDLGA